MRNKHEVSSQWIGKVPSQWEIKNMKYLVKVQTGYAFNSDDYSDTGIPLIRIGEIDSKGNVNLENAKKLPVNFVDLYRNYVVKSGDYIMAMTGATIGKVGKYLSENIALLNQRVCKFSPGIQLNHKFLWYVLNSESYIKYVRFAGFGGAQPNISDTELLDFIVGFPDQVEQIQISSFLDRETSRIDNLIEKKQRLIELLQEKRQALITNAITKGLDPNVLMKDSGIPWLGEVPEHWELKRLGIETTVKARLGWKGLTASEYVDNGYVLLATPNIKNFYIDFENVNYISEYRYLESPEIMLKKNDVLLAKDGSTLGIVNVVRDLPRPATVNSSIAVIRPKSNVHSVFLYYFLQSNYIQHIIQQHKDGMGVPHLFQRDINKFNILNPPIQEQIEIANYLDDKAQKIVSIIKKIQTQITKLQEYRQALITAAVTGKIDVREKVGS